MSSSYLHDLAVDLLTAAEAAIAPECTGHVLPSRRYVSWTEPAHDLCSDDAGTDGSGQLNVWWDTFPSPQIIARGNVCAVRLLGTICVELARCVPDLDEDSTPFAPAVYEDAAEFMHVEAWPLLRGVTAWVAALGCAYKQIDASIPALSGGSASIRICATIELNDPDPACTL